MRLPILFLLCGSVLVACDGDKEAKTPGGVSPAGDSKPAAGATTDHGQAVALGTATVAGHTFAITRLGEIAPGKEGAFEVKLAGDSKGKPMAGLSLFLWVETKEGEQISAPAKGDVEGDGWHLHVVPRTGAGEPFRAVLRVRADGKDERAGLPLSGHGHEHGDSPHHGIVAAFRAAEGAAGGHLELKLHGDKGDLELWIAKDAKISQPLDLPMDTKIKVVFIDHGNREATLAVRNRGKNEDEGGTPNAREGKTNYFIFPGDSGQDASWLKGKEFQSIVKVTFENGGGAFSSEEFVLVPHTHDGEEAH